MGVKCQICHKNQGVYIAGQKVEGVVIFVLDKPTEYQSVVLSLHGSGKSKWSTRDDDDTSYYRDKVVYVNYNLNLLHHPRTLETGTHEYPFQFPLPDGIPSSFKNKTCTISYVLTVKFEKANLFSLSKEFNTEIVVAGLVDSIREPLPIFIEKTLFKLFSKKNHMIIIKGELTTTCMEPGGILHLNMIVDNDTDTEPVISAHLYQRVICLAKKNKLKKKPKKVEGCSSAVAIKKRSKVNITLTVPLRRDLYTIVCQVLRREYVLRVELNLLSPHSNSKVELPVVIGFKRTYR